MTSIAQSKNHMCDMCQQGFNSKPARDQHRRDKHTQSFEQPEPSPSVVAPSSQTKTHICNKGQKGFNSKLARNAHRQAKHFPSPRQSEPSPAIVHHTTQSKAHTCDICQKDFGTNQAKVQHRLSKHSGPKARQATTNISTPPSPAPIAILSHRGIDYSTLSAAEIDTIRSKLAVLCHSEQRLRKEGYKLSNTTAAQNEGSSTTRAHLPCPDNDPSMPKRSAIVLDCEMAGASNGQNELIQVTMIDFLSGDILQSCLVNPSMPIQDWREDITGINNLIMADAVEKNKALHGWEAARAELWRFADKETIVIGHSAHYDLKALHTLHTRVIDTAIVTAEAVLGKNSKTGKRWGLATLCHELLGIQIRASLQPGQKAVHDALEDSLATRELLLLCIQKPYQLKRWTRMTKAAFFKARGNKPGPSLASSSQRPRYYTVVESFYYDDDDDDEYEYGEQSLRWEDVVDWEIWPKSPPDSD